MTRILMVGNDSSVKGGITTVINQFREYNWKKQDIEYKFIPTYIDKNVVFKILFFVIAYIKIFLFMMFRKPKYIHIHMSYKGSFARANKIQNLAKLFKIKNVIHLHGSEFEKWYNVCNKSKQNKIKKLLRNSDYFIVLGNEWKEIVKRIEPNTNLIVVRNAVDIKQEMANWNEKIFCFLFLGVLIKRKGIFDLLEAISNLNKEDKIENVKFVIAGTGKEEENIKLKIKELNIEKYIDFIGWVDGEKKNAVIKGCQTLILPSYNEGLPMSILEGMSYGLPIIATNVGDIGEAVINNKNGYLIESGNIKELEQAIIRMKLLSEKEWKDMSSFSKQILNEKFSNKNYMDFFVKLYKSNKIE